MPFHPLDTIPITIDVSEIVDQVKYAWDNFFNKDNYMSTVISIGVVLLALILFSKASRES